MAVQPQLACLLAAVFFLGHSWPLSHHRVRIYRTIARASKDGHVQFLAGRSAGLRRLGANLSVPARSLKHKSNFQQNTTLSQAPIMDCDETFNYVEFQQHCSVQIS